LTRSPSFAARHLTQVLDNVRSALPRAACLGSTVQARLFVPEAFTNPEHLKFKLKGGLAAILCYIIYSSLAWPEISTSLNCCLLTALTTIGASRQKQVLRFTGALTDGMTAGPSAKSAP
jgi:multidrug resistance protein MdtO